MPVLPTFSNQSKLPRLPIPTLEDTTKKYLNSVKAVVSTDEEFSNTQRAVNEFIRPNGIGHVLQERLIARDQKEPKSWLEKWWLSLAYMTWRESSLINSNWYLLLKNQPYFGPPPPKSGFTDFQVERAAGIINNLINYKEMLDNEKIPAEFAKDIPLCMHQYTRMFSLCRVPKPGEDILVGGFKVKSKHIVVSALDQVYSVYVYDAVTGGRLPVKAIVEQLKWIVEDVTNKMNKMEPAMGLLTAQHRDTWAELREYIDRLSPVNVKSFNEIETALFYIALDNYPLSEDVTDLAKNVFHGRKAHNRWFDKTLSFIFSNDGKAGLNGEHSPCDALIPAYVTEYAAANEPAKDPENAVKYFKIKTPKRLNWVVDEKIVKAIESAEQFAAKLIGDSDVSVLIFKEYGSDFIKAFGKTSPDAYIQMCLQIAYHRMHNKFAATYETASTRQYLHGRTETCRSLSVQSVAFVKGFENPSLTPKEKFALFQTACKAHVEYIASAAAGYGVDRHLLGLRMCLQSGESASIFKDPMFAKSSRWQLSTSNLFSGANVQVAGFGCVDPEGYGTNYMIMPTLVRFGIESKHSCPVTSTTKLKETLTEVLLDLREVCEKAAESKL